ncbi:MAG: signal recognition particle-docking protein FtsY [Andreesenia angusta]|nr:signal recognition particle-docking protein FtsY [Andreesenia angusta]
MLKKFFRRNKEKEEIIDQEEEEKIEEEIEDSEEENIEEIIEEDENTPEEEKLEEEKLGIFSKFKKGLTKTRDGIMGKVDNVLKSYRKIDEELFEDLEEILIMADIGVETSLNIIEDVKDKVRERKLTEVNDIKGLLKEEMQEILDSNEKGSKLNIDNPPSIILVVGVNGAGKTTTIGKLSAKFRNEGKKVIIAAGDTFRAAAIEQLEEWANRSNVDIIAHAEGADPGAVIFDGIQSAKAKKADILICDTAGRLHNRKNLMNELSKIFRIVDREFPEASREVLLVVDATTGQNAIQQAKIFKEACDITGIVLTKLDGTAKGGVVIGVQSEVDVPVKLVGVGEGIDDLQEFDSKSFVDAIFGEDEI